MVDIKLLNRNETYLIALSDENDSDSIESLTLWRSKYNSENVSYRNNNLMEIKGSKTIITKKRNGEKRLPTRRPDPNVYNRNALLARENRRKKKVYLEMIEKELQVTRKANRALAKALKRQLKIAQRLEQEKNFFANLVTNRSCTTFVNPLNCYDISESDESLFYTTGNNEDYMSACRKDGTSPESISSCIQDADGSITAPKESSLYDFSSSDFCTFPEFFTDVDKCTNFSLPTASTTWDDIWSDKDYNDNIISGNITIPQTIHDMESFHDDHCYVSTRKIIGIENREHNEPSDYIDVKGDDCSHIGKFCSICSWNSTCRTPPLQLLSDQS